MTTFAILRLSRGLNGRGDLDALRSESLGVSELEKNRFLFSVMLEPTLHMSLLTSSLGLPTVLLK